MHQSGTTLQLISNFPKTYSRTIQLFGMLLRSHFAFHIQLHFIIHTNLILLFEIYFKQFFSVSLSLCLFADFTNRTPRKIHNAGNFEVFTMVAIVHLLLCIRHSVVNSDCG